MKTNNLIVAIVILFSMASCQTSYRMVSRIKTDGSLYREVYAYGDSAFLAGDRAENPFLFHIDSDTWQLVGLGSSIKFNFWGNEQELNVKVCRDIPGMSGEYFEVSDTKEYAAPLAVPQEILEKKFRWFYTYYSYKAIYSELPDKGPVPLDRYFSDEERQIWFRGDENAFAGWNGIELNNRLDDIENKFWEWYNRSQYEISFEVVAHFTSLQGDTSYIRRLQESKEDIYSKYVSKKEKESTPEEVCDFLNDLWQTKYFSNVYKANEKDIDKMAEDRGRIVELFGYTMRNELIMPGKVIASNAMFQQGDSAVIWKVDAFRLLAGGYELAAESRIPNYWAFAATLLAILFAFWLSWRAYRK